MVHSEGSINLEHRLSAIVIAEIVDLPRLIDVDEEGSYASLRLIKHEVTKPMMAKYNGRFVKLTADALLAEFQTVHDAMDFSIEVQRELYLREKDKPQDRRIILRIGVNMGDIIISEDGDIYGDGVNVAARLKDLACPGGICVSGLIFESYRKGSNISFNDLGQQEIKNIKSGVRAYDVDLGDSSWPPTKRPKSMANKSKNLLVVAAAIIVGLLVINGWQYLSGPKTPQRQVSELSVAVLPFVNMSSDPEQEYFSDGITEEILDDLAKLPGLNVTARTSAFYFKGKNIPIPEIAETLGVANVIEGSVRKSGNQIRITAQMIRASDGFHVWSETYDRELNDIFAIQDEISLAIVNALKMKFDFETENNGNTQNLEAHNLYLRARALMAERGSENLNAALALLDQAILIDPDYADAYAAKSRILSVIISYDYSWSRERAEIGIEEAATKALSLDPNNGEAYTARGNSQFFTQGKWIEAEKNLSRALELIPNNVSIHNSFGDYSIFTMDVERALYHELRATTLDPLSSVHVFDLSRAYSARGDKERATDLLYTIAEFGVVAEYLTLDLLEAGKFAEVQTLWNEIYKDTPLDENLKGRAIQMMVNMVTNQNQQYDTVPEVIRQALEQKVLQPSFVGRLYLIMGNIDEALVHYNVSYETGDSYLYYFPFTKTRDHYPDHAGWQTFWSLPGMSELDIIRTENMDIIR